MNIRRLGFAVAALTLALCLPASGPAANAPPADELRAKLAAFLEGAAAEGFTGVVVVARAGEVLLERGYGLADSGKKIPVSAETVFTTGSITKQFTAAAILVLEQDGRLSIDDPIAKYFADVPDDKRAITLHHLLSHQAGFPGAIGDDRERIGRDAFVVSALAGDLLFRPGAAYEYSNVGFSLAAAFVEIVSGEDYEAFLHERLFAPAGMHDTGYHLPRWQPERLAHGVARDGSDWGTIPGVMFSDGGPGWHLLGNGGIQSTAGDMLRWHRALRGETILSAASKAKMYAKHADEGGGTWYGYGWSIEPTPWGELVTHNGGNPYFFADYLRFLDDDVVVYYTTSSHDRRMKRLARPLARIVFTGEVPELEPAAAELAAPGTAPATPGSAAARWGLPGTPSGERAEALLDALSSADVTARSLFAAEGFAPDVVSRRGVEALAQLLERMRGDLGDFRLRGFRQRGERGLTVVLAAAGGPAPMQVEIDVESEPPHRIVGLGVQMGD